MTKQLYIIEYQSAHWCGASDNVLVWAFSENCAEVQAEGHMSEHLLELYSDEYEEIDDAYTDECPYTVVSIEPFNEAHEYWGYFCDPSQAEFYPVIGEPE
jgi:hypothetical protein